MKIYDTSYGPDTFGRIRMGLIQEMILSYVGYSRPEPGDQLRISCTFKGVVRDVFLVNIVTAVDSYDEKEAVLIRVKPEGSDAGRNTCGAIFGSDYLTELKAKTIRH